jgi:zinc protease
MKKIFSTVVAFCAAATMSLSAQAPAPLPVDPAVRMGTLDNGLTYYIRHNEEPKERCEFHIAQAVGASLEEDNQNGLAHFLEHMAFNGTEHFPGKLIINYFESIGVGFGGDINAYTSLDETVYRLSNVPTYREKILDSALLVLYDWSCAISLLEEEIDNERGVIREEWRQGANANRRLWKELNAEKYPGTRYAIRDVIGDTAVINNFTYQALRNYYHKWYGPDLQTIVVVGDIDIDKMERKLKNLFSKIPARANRGDRPTFPLGENKEPIIARATDPEGQYTINFVEIKHPELPREFKLSQQGYTLLVINNLVSQMIGNRFQEMAMDPDASFVQGFGSFSNINGVTDGMRMINVAKGGQEEQAYRDLLIETERIKRYGFTVTEFERAKADYASAMEKAYNNRDNRKSQNLAEESYRHSIDAVPMPGMEWEYEFSQQFLPMLTVDMINQIVKAQITDENVILAIQGPDKKGVSIPNEKQMLSIWKEVKASEIEAPKEEKIDRPLVEKEPAKPGTIKKETRDAKLGTTEWTLSNGVRVVFKPTKFKQDEILFNAFSEGGMSKFETEDLISATFATDVIETNGLGTFSIIDLQKVLAGKNVSISPSINSYSESLRGSTTVNDFETLMQLTYLYFTAPRHDDKAFSSMIGQYRTILANKDANPKAAFSDSVSAVTTSHNERTLIIDVNTLDKVSQTRAIELFKERFAAPSDFTFVFVGNIDPQNSTTREIILKWIGGMESKKVNEKFTDRNIRYPKGDVKNYFSRNMTVNAATNRIMYTGDMAYNLKNDLNMNVIGMILGTRYLESIREREGGSYGVGTRGYVNMKPVNTAVLLMQFDTDPEKQVRLMEIIHDEVAKIVKDGPLAEDLAKAKENLIKDYKQDIEGNNYWLNAINKYYVEGIDAVNPYVDTVNGITAETVQTTLKALVDQNNVIEIVMSPEK